jgi:Type I phosphodiesterase / nucleotide pyrophosphatase
VVLQNERVDRGVSERPEGLLVIQIDGLSRPLLEELMAEGRMPVLAGLVRSGRLVVDSWIPQLPPCTPASQAGILHGRNDGVPGFRWYEKSSGRLLEANRPRDASEIAGRVSDGHGLLVEGGASIGNLLTGDAPSSHLTLATIEGDPSGHDRSTRAGGYPLDPRVYARIVGLMVIELVREVAAAVRGDDRSDPLRASLRWRYFLQRSVSSVPLRLLSTALVAGAMRHGRPVVYVDFTGHDEVAHSRGPRSPEARRAATSIDDSIGAILRGRRHAPRRYRLVVLSDHGQSWGASFSERYGVPLEQLIAQAMGPGTRFHGATLPTEYHDSGVRLAGHVLPGPIGSLGAGIAERLRHYRRRSGVSDGSAAGAGAGEGAGPPATHAGDDPASSDVVVAASGNLALVALPKIAGQATKDEIDRRHPGLLETLARHPGIAVVVVRTAGGPVAIGRAGTHDLVGGRIEGEDPLAPFDPGAAGSLRRLAGFKDSGDIILLGSVDAGGAVVTFEELVGSHGGLGGWQAQPFIAHPAEWQLDEHPPVGAPALYRQLRRWMAMLGIRRLDDDESAAA